MHVFCLCAYSFVICWSHLIVFGTHFALLGATLGFLLGAFGVPWAPKRPSLASLWCPFGSLGTPWGHLGHHGLPRGAWDDFGSKMEVQFRADGSQIARLRTKSYLAEFSGGSAGSAQWAQSGARAAAPNPTSLAPGGQDDGSLDKLPQSTNNHNDSSIDKVLLLAVVSIGCYFRLVC